MTNQLPFFFHVDDGDVLKACGNRSANTGSALLAAPPSHLPLRYDRSVLLASSCDWSCHRTPNRSPSRCRSLKFNRPDCPSPKRYCMWGVGQLLRFGLLARARASGELSRTARSFVTSSPYSSKIARAHATLSPTRWPLGWELDHSSRFWSRLSARSPLMWCTFSSRVSGRPSSCSMSHRCSKTCLPSTVMTR
jgi:hypothetical protein